MSGWIPVLILAGSLLVLSGRLLAEWRKNGRANAVTIEEYSAARAALDSVFVETAAIKRIFADEDVKFISESGVPEVQRFFLKERKRLGIQWLRITQKQVAQLMQLHLKLASYTYEPSPKFEFELTVKYACFILISNALLVLLWFFGPFEIVRVVSHTLGVAEHFCSAFSLRLEKVDPAKLGPTQ